MTKVTWKIVALIITILFLGVISWLGRYEIIGVAAGGQGNQGSAYRLDRWTGEIVWIYGVSAGKVEIKESGATTP